MVHNQEPQPNAMDTNIATTGQVATAANDVDMTQEDMSDDVSFTSAEGVLQNGHDVTSDPENDVTDSSHLDNAVAKAVQVHSNNTRSDSPTLSGQIDGVTVITNQPEQLIVS